MLVSFQALPPHRIPSDSSLIEGKAATLTWSYGTPSSLERGISVPCVIRPKAKGHFIAFSWMEENVPVNWACGGVEAGRQIICGNSD